MANEFLTSRGTQKTLEANGGSIANNAVGQANDADWASSDSGNFPDGEFALSCAFGTAPTANRSIDLIIKPLNIDGTNDAPDPAATYLHHYVGSFVPKDTTSTQYLFLQVKNLPLEGQAWLYNNNTGQTISAGWTLKFTPLALKST